MILPGFGALIANESGASIDFQRGLISPRLRSLSFNSSVLADDGLLAHSISRREHLPYEEAHRLLSSEIDKMRADLRKEGETSLGMIGRLMMDSEGLITFQPRRSQIMSDIMPLIPLALPVEDSAGLDDDQDLSDQSDDDKDYYVIRISRRAAHAAAMVVAILTVAVSLLIPINHDRQQKASVVPIPSLSISLPEEKEPVVEKTDSLDFDISPSPQDKVN